MVEFVHLNYCGHCGGKLIKDTDSHYTCDSCEMHTFNNAGPGASPLIFKDDKVLLSIRGIEPRKGAYDTIGGFLDWMEQPEDCAKREFLEETGAEITNLEIVGASTIRYTKNQCALDMMFIADLVDPEAELKAADDIAELRWVPVDEVDNLDVDKEKIPLIKKGYEIHKRRQANNS